MADNNYPEAQPSESSNPNDPNSNQQGTPVPVFISEYTDEALFMLPSPQRGFIRTIREICANADTPSNVLHSIAEIIPPARMFSKDICDLGTAHANLKYLLRLIGNNLPDHSSRSTLRTLAANIWSDPMDKQAANDIVSSIISFGRENRFSRSEPATSDQKVAQNLAIRLKDKDKKFSRAIQECWMDFVDGYEQIANDYNLSDSNKLKFLHNLLRDDAKRFFNHNKNNIRNYVGALETIDREYNSPVRQDKVKNYLSSLRVSKYVAEGLTLSRALRKVYQEITRLSRQVPPAHHGEPHRIEFLRRAVVGYDWAEEPIIRIGTIQMGFQRFYEELESKVQARAEAQTAALKDSVLNNQGKQGSSAEHEINYAGQQRLGRHPSLVRPRGQQHATHGTNASASSSAHKHSSHLSGCFNSGERGHVLRECKKPLDIKRAAKARLNFLNNKYGRKTKHTNLVIINLCKQIEDAAEADNF